MISDVVSSSKDGQLQWVDLVLAGEFPPSALQHLQAPGACRCTDHE